MDEVVEGGLLLAHSLVLVHVILDDFTGTLVDSLYGHLVYDVVTFLDEIIHLGSEIVSAQGALILNFEPLATALGVEVVLLVAGKDHDFVVSSESHQADGAVGHLVVLILILFVAQVLQILHVSLQ